jgi:hypothetical protein
MFWLWLSRKNTDIKCITRQNFTPLNKDSLKFFHTRLENNGSRSLWSSNIDVHHSSFWSYKSYNLSPIIVDLFHNAISQDAREEKGEQMWLRGIGRNALDLSSLDWAWSPSSTQGVLRSMRCKNRTEKGPQKPSLLALDIKWFLHDKIGSSLEIQIASKYKYTGRTANSGFCSCKTSCDLRRGTKVKCCCKEVKKKKRFVVEWPEGFCYIFMDNNS